MSSIEEVKAALLQAAEHGNQTVNQIQAAAAGIDQMLGLLRAASAGTGHPKIAEALARGEQSRQRLAEAAALVQGGSQAAREYVQVLG
ncbi:hypothetical protein [Micromonospora zhanjiangensis]|uniref:Excreted virulence factor EspC, type VII ESX diderm n=1 Tax=Micromonospora zhanjiangensis TaxID=1522057 RepID=A0ABV8KW36_9ACTN